MVKTNSVTAAVQALLNDLVLDLAGSASASIAVALAGKLDAAAGSNSGAVTIAAAGLAKELRAVLAELLATQEQDDELLARLFGDKP